MPVGSDFVPKRRLISNITQAQFASVTTSEDHGYKTGQWVRLIVPLAYGMELDYVQTQITVTSTTQFTTTFNTVNQLPFVSPVYPPAFTQAHVVPISGVEDNISR